LISSFSLKLAIEVGKGKKSPHSKKQILTDVFSFSSWKQLQA